MAIRIHAKKITVTDKWVPEDSVDNRAAGNFWRTYRQLNHPHLAPPCNPQLPVLASQLASELRRSMNNELNFPPNVERLVLGCIDASKQASKVEPSLS